MGLGIVCGLLVGALDVLLMLPMSFPDKRAALLGAFSSRFLIGFFTGTSRLPLTPVLSGILIGVLTSIPDAIITKAYAPILVTGVIFGAVVGWIVGRWGQGNERIKEKMS
jgi:hypothetical protein